MSYWQNKVCLVTGGSAGLGLAIGRALARGDAKVVLMARNKEPLETAADGLRSAGGDVTTIAGDVAWQEDVDRLAASVNEKFGRLDFLCNGAGRSTRGAALETSPEDFQQLLDVNFLATVRTTRALAPLLITSRGHLVNIGSLASKVGARYMGAYPASKFAVAAYTQQLRLELGDRGLHVMLVCPGPIARVGAGPRYAAAEGVPEIAQRPGAGARVKAIDPDWLAGAILKACERRRPELVVPAKAKLLFAISQLSARCGDWLLRRSTGG
jgi:NAD(P)-dependent dehydrogenase (short-subunit alcohol dehydrogenase family)